MTSFQLAWHLNWKSTAPTWSSFGPPLVSRNAGERRVKDHLSAHAHAKPIVAHTKSTCLFHLEIQKLVQKLFQHASGKNVGERSYDAEKTCQTELREL